MKRNSKINNKIKYKNVFKMDSDESDTTDANSELEHDGYVLTKGKGFIATKIKKKRRKRRRKI